MADKPPIDDFLSPEIAASWLSAIIESADDAIVSKNLDGIIQSWNRGAERLFGYTADEVIGKSVTILIPEDHLDEEPQILARLRRGERIDHYETVRQRKDGELLDISLTVSPIRAPDGTIVGASKIAHDITERKQSEATCARLLHEAQQANRMKDEFLAVTSHELRTPLNAILGWAAMIRAGETDEKETKYGLQIMEQCAKAQAQLIDDLLDYGRIGTGKLTLDIHPVDVRAMIEAAIDTVRPAIEAKNMRLRVLVDDIIGTVAGDEARLQQVMWNLLSNAVKFTPPDGQVQIRAQRDESQVQIIVSDSGQGIAPDFLPHIFERFQQADMSSTRTHGGLGLGLAIVKSIVELHGGTVSAFSEGQNTGATFVVSLPFKSASRDEIPALGTPVRGIHGISVESA